MIDISTTVNVDATHSLIITVPAEVIEQLKTMNLVGAIHPSVIAQCVVGIVPNEVRDFNEEDIFL